MKKNKAPKELSYTLYVWRRDTDWKCYNDIKPGSTNKLTQILNVSELAAWDIEKPDAITTATLTTLDQDELGQPVVTIIVNPKLYEMRGFPPNPWINKEPK